MNIPTRKVRKLFDYVLDAGEYTSLDYAFTEKMAKADYDFRGGLCSAAAAAVDGKTLIGRNMDLYISNRPAYVVRTNVPGCRKTVGLSYFHLFGPVYGEALNGGLDDGFAKRLPFFCTDVMNDSGLYMETNMRTGEYNDDGSSKYGCSGTNPGAEKRVCAMLLPRYVCERCNDVDEALKYLETLDIYTPGAKNMDWNFCFMLADAKGRFGVLEIACNRLSWLEGERIQTNFYLTKEFAADEHMKAGLGRYDVLKNGLDSIKTKDDLYRLMDRVSYFQMYMPNACAFDCRSELIGAKENWTSEYVTDEANREEIEAELHRVAETVKGLSRQALQDRGSSWESVFTLIADCNSKTLFVRFFEDEKRTLTLAV